MQKSKGRTVAYIRLSREDKATLGTMEEKFRVRAQIVKDLAVRHHLSLSDSDIYYERESGTSLARRPVMSALLEECRAGRVSVVLSPYQDRVTRGSDHDRGDVKESLCAGRVLLITTEGEIDFGADFGDRHELIYDIKAAVASHYVRDVIKKKKEADLVRLREGKIGRICAPYGFYRVKRADVLEGNYPADQLNKFLVIEAEYAILQEILERVQREAVSAIVADLNARVVPPPGATRAGRGSRQWHVTALYSILRNPFYAGFLAQRKRVERGRGSVRLHPSEYVFSEVKGDWLQPLDEEGFRERVQAHTPVSRKAARTALLTGLLYCPHGCAMHLTSGTLYGCDCPTRGDRHRGRNLSQSKVEAWSRRVVTALVEAFPDDTIPSAHKSERERGKAQMELTAVRRELSEREGQAQEMILREAYFVSLLGRVLYEETARKAAQEMGRLRARLQTLEEIVHVPNEYETLSVLMRIRRNGGLSRFWQEGDIAAQREFIVSLLKRLDVLEPQGRYVVEVKPHVWEWVGEMGLAIEVPPFPGR